MQRNPHDGRTRGITLAALAAVLLLASQAQATILGVGPAKLEFRDATRGESYLGHLTASTTDKKLQCKLTATGDIAEWIKLGNDTFTLTSGAQYRFPVRVNVPKATPNGVYKGIIEIKSTPADEGGAGTGMNVGAAIYITTSVTVTGADGDWFRVTKVTVSNANAGGLIDAEITVRNNAGRKITPATTLRVQSRDKKRTYATSSITSQPIDAMSAGTITARLPTTGMEPGLYAIAVNVKVDAKDLWNSDETFYILNPEASAAEVRAEGLLEDATLSNANISLGEDLTFTAKFRNTGNVPLDPRMRVEITKDGKTTASLTGDTEYAEAGETKSLSVRHKPAESGEYAVRIWVEYAGTRTAVREARMKVWTYGTPLTGLDIDPYLLAVPAIILIVLWLILYYRKYYAREE
jgi:hypothetical protein